MKYGYVRVNTKKQANENNIDEQIRDILKIYTDEDITIYEEHLENIKYNKVLNDLISNLVPCDTLVVTSLDKLYDNIEITLGMIELLLEIDITVHILDMGIINNSILGKQILKDIKAFAAFQKEINIKKIYQGKSLKNINDGRPNKFSEKEINAALKMLSVNKGNMSYSQVSKETGISRSTLIRENNKRKISEVL